MQGLQPKTKSQPHQLPLEVTGDSSVCVGLSVPDSQMWDNPKFESKHKSNYQFRIRRRIPVDDPHRDE
ncbi:hypothetical protein QVD99_002680 [Batrachochytrium dendrobatidis]|nr:hypothetical protein QVD99_002680 [Batrachochytrium dendrobatidis]